MPRSSAARMARIDLASSVPPHIQPPIAQVPSPMREVTIPVSMISMVSNGCPPDSAVAVSAELLSAGCGGAAGEQGDHSPDEGGQVIGLAARHQVAVLNHC